MQSWKRAVRKGLVAGAVASLLSTAVLMRRGQREAGAALGPTNAISHWLWGEGAACKQGLSLRYSAIGYCIHHASATFWAVLYEKIFGARLARAARNQGAAMVPLASGTAMAAVACFVDYQITPRRLHPGYEKRLSRTSLALVYGAFGLGLALPHLMAQLARR